MQVKINNFWENKQDCWKIIHWSTKKQSEFTFFVFSRKEVGLLLLSNRSHFSCPSCCWFTHISEIFWKFWCIKMWALCWIESSEAQVCGGHCAQKQSLLCVFQGHGKVYLLSCHTSGHFWNTVWKWVRSSSCFSMATLMHLWSADLLLTPAGRLIILIFFSASSRGNWTDHVFRNKTRFACWRRKSQYLLSRICHQL